MVPVMDGAIFPPIFGIFGLWILLRSLGITLWCGWVTYPAIWLVSTILTGLAIIAIGILGEKQAEKINIENDRDGDRRNA